MKREDIIRVFQAIGRASLESQLQNSHSGNMARAFLNEAGQPSLAITKSGAQKGDLSPEDIIFIDPKKPYRGQASSELVVHRAILQLPGVRASFHAHAKQLTLAVLLTQGLKRSNSCFKLMDGPGNALFGRSLPLVKIEKAYGSTELAREVARRLQKNVVVAVVGHGIFSRGANLVEAFFYAGIANFSGQVVKLLYRARSLIDKWRHAPKVDETAYYFCPPDNLEAADELALFSPKTAAEKEIQKTRNRIFASALAPFFIGSLSLREGKDVFYTERASTPVYIGGPLNQLPWVREPGGPEEYRWHWMILRKTGAAAVLRGHIAEAEAVAWDLLSAERGAHDYFEPVDVEGKFWQPRVPVLAPPVEAERFLANLQKEKAVIIRGGGVWTVGQSGLSEALHRLSSVKDSCFYYLGLRERQTER